MRRICVLGFLVVVVLLAGACSRGEDTPEDNSSSTELESQPVGPEISIADATMVIRSERAPVEVNDAALEAGDLQNALPGDKVKIGKRGTAQLTAEAVFEIEALRGANFTVPALAKTPITVPMNGGHLVVRLNKRADAQVVVDTGARQFITRSPDAHFAVCQAGDGASCLVVVKGEVEWNEDGVASETYSAGRASFAVQGNAPEPDRCASSEDLGVMRSQLSSTDFAGVLADIVATWDPCEAEDPQTTDVALPSAARMEQVEVAEIIIGSPDVDTDSPTRVKQKTLSGSANFYIEPLTATNSEFRTWLANTAGDDTALWTAYAPDEWLQRAPGGAKTQATYSDGEADLAVTGVSFGTAQAFCAAQNKRLATEIEWDLAASNEVLEDLTDNAQDWVSDWEAYGPGPDNTTNRQVLRGANGILEADLYHRDFALDEPEATAARQSARVRCAATEVAIGGRSFTREVFRDDFNSKDWPELIDDPLEAKYHPENYHLDIHQHHSQGVVVRTLASTLDEGRIDVDLFIERNNTGAGSEAYRFGIAFGRADELMTLTLEPDEFNNNSFLACVRPLDPVLETESEPGPGGNSVPLNLISNPQSPDDKGRVAMFGPANNHTGHRCEGSATSIEVEVTDIDNAVRMSVVLIDGKLEAWVNETPVDTATSLSSIDVYGFFSQTYERPRSHIHFDDVIISN